MPEQLNYPLIAAEISFCSTITSPSDVLVIGSGIGLFAANCLAKKNGQLSITVVDAGPLDLVTHVANSRLPRSPLLRRDTRRIGGKLTLWGMSAPRPPLDILKQWPYDVDDLNARFASVESEMGIAEPTPYSDRLLESEVIDRLSREMPHAVVRRAPLAINRDGRRWSSVNYIADLAARGVRIVPRFECKSLYFDRHEHCWLVRGIYNGNAASLQARNVILATGVEASLPLLRQVYPAGTQLRTADHIRIDLHDQLERRQFCAGDDEALGIAVVLVDLRGGASRVPYHLEVKLAPVQLWRRGYLPSSDNLRGIATNPDGLWLQIQAVAGMHDEIPSRDLLNIPEAIPPVMSARDAMFHGEIVRQMSTAAAALGAGRPHFVFRQLTENHHLYGALRVGQHVDPNFRLIGTEDLYVLPPTAFPATSDDANPTLKSAVLTQYACDQIIRRSCSNFEAGNRDENHNPIIETSCV